MVLDSDKHYRPAHHHIDRRAGSSTGGVSQICFGEAENTPPHAAKGARGDASAVGFAERNAASSVFSAFDAASPAHPPSTGRARVAGRDSAQTSQRHFSSDEPAPALLFGSAPARAAPPAPNPLLGGSGGSLLPAERPSTAQRSRQDPNRPSQDGGIFGMQPAGPTFQPRPHKAIEEAPSAKYGSKRMVNNRMEYCA